ncbi:MAG: hypothetical protein JW395_1920 [Nitrospira sp.]|nr:hypothetical protein [Nitrospira sp.]
MSNKDLGPTFEIEGEIRVSAFGRSPGGQIIRVFGEGSLNEIEELKQHIVRYFEEADLEPVAAVAHLKDYQ